MQTRTSLWEMLASSGDFALETKLIIDNTEYTEISAPIIDRALCKETIEVGNCIAGSLTVAVRTTDTFPTGAAVEVWKRVWNASRETSSEWITAGTFYISKRQKDYASGLVSLTCYDAMLKGSENFYLDDPTVDMTGWPHSMTDVVTYIAGRMGVQIDSRTTLRTETRYRIMATPQGTLLDVLGHIGACMGGNWTITPEGKLRLVPLTTAPTDSTIRANRVKAVTELGETYTRWSAIDSGNVEHYGEWGMQDGYVVLVDEDPDPTTDTEIAAILSRLGTSDAITITKISMTDDLESDTYTAGTDTGYQLAITGNPYCSQEICNDLLQTLGGIEYHPFDANGAIYDPAAELGDPVLYKNIYYSTLMTEKANLNVAFRGDIGAPSNKEIEDEYPYKSPARKDYQKAAAMANDARKEAVNYLSRDDRGIMVARMTDENRYTPSNVPPGVKNTFIDDASFQVRDGQEVLASFGEESRIGKEDENHLDIDTTGLTGVNADGVQVFMVDMDGGVEDIPVVPRTKILAIMDDITSNTPKTRTVSLDKFDITQGKPVKLNIRVTLSPGNVRSQELKIFTYGTDSQFQVSQRGATCNVVYSASDNTLTFSGNIAKSSPFTAVSFLILLFSYYTTTSLPAFQAGTRANDTIGGFSGTIGEALSASTRDQFACGRYNIEDPDYAFMVGNGSEEDGDSNALAVTWDGTPLIALDETATTGTDAELYNAITALGWESEVLVW